MRLYRPVGIAELRLIAATGFRAFPSRLNHQPIFYPVLTLEYAREIARDWNTKDEASGFAGFVTEFEVDDGFVSQYPVQVAGARRHEELWVPAEDLAEFNRHIIDAIDVIESYAGDNFVGCIDARTHLPEDFGSPGRGSMDVVYKLRDDPQFVANVQKATRTTEEFGIEPTHGLLGTPVWWDNIESGRLLVHTIRGTIVRVYMTSMNDWPEFEVLADTGGSSRWTREANTKEQASMYAPGRRVEIDYVLQRHRPASLDGSSETKVVVEIRIGDAVQPEGV